ncbi:hypothetical protein S40285_04028 [Stachybotrys chlorohalonatus IBT 40285]|uniref:Uncharacterized protein n=1 Tax=Stachybotrys chlorohalonatus (strain IBT 40285) TaxID=1283841 RepID=A0A084R0C4_STAC4|nr:hypothetical protein S40285_04028 [Stachybotrys chlorohalonata IBT 40285]
MEPEKQLLPLDRHIVSLLPPLHPHPVITSLQTSKILQLEVVDGDSVGPGGRHCCVEIAFRQHFPQQPPRSAHPEQFFWTQYLGGGTEASSRPFSAFFTTPDRVVSLLISRHDAPNFVKCQGCVDVFNLNSDEPTHVLAPFHDYIFLDTAADARCFNCIWYGNASCALRRDLPPPDDKIDFLQDAPIIFPLQSQDHLSSPTNQENMPYCHRDYCTTALPQSPRKHHGPAAQRHPRREPDVGRPHAPAAETSGRTASLTDLRRTASPSPVSPQPQRQPRRTWPAPQSRDAAVPYVHILARAAGKRLRLPRSTALGRLAISSAVS